MTQFLTQDGPIPPYMAFPRFLLDKDGLNETAKILYTILFDRARLSQNLCKSPTGISGADGQKSFQQTGGKLSYG